MSYTIVIAITFLVPLESLQWRGIHQGSFVMFKLMMQELFNIEQFVIWKLNKIKTKKIGKLGHVFGIVGKC
jgi:hypothetical protein